MKNFDLIWAREYAGVTQTKIAEIFGVSRRTVINWEQGRSKLPPAKFKYLLSVLDIDPKLVPQNTNPEPATAPAANPVPKEPAPVTTPSQPKKRTWKNRDYKRLRDDLLDLVVGISDRQETFDVPELMVAFLRFWGKDDTVIRDAWQLMYSMLRLFETDFGWVRLVNRDVEDHDDWVWTLTKKGWEAIEKTHMEYTVEGDAGLAEVYPRAHARLFESLV